MEETLNTECAAARERHREQRLIKRSADEPMAARPVLICRLRTVARE
jgi:hypothetical protein